MTVIQLQCGGVGIAQDEVKKSRKGESEVVNMETLYDNRHLRLNFLFIIDIAIINCNHPCILALFLFITLNVGGI